MAEQLKQNNNKIAYIVSSGNYHRKVYMTATCNSTRDVQTTTAQYTGTYHVDDEANSGSCEISGTFSSTSTYNFYTDGYNYDRSDIETNPVYPFMTEQHGVEWEDNNPVNGFQMQADASISTTQQTTTQQTYTTTTNQLYVLKSYSKTGIIVDITALTTNTSRKFTYSGTNFIYSITSSTNKYKSNSGRILLINSYTTTSSNSIDIYASSIIAESVNIYYNDTYRTLLYTNTSIKYFSSSSIDTRLRTTTLSEFNGQSSTSYTTNRYNKALSYYSISNTYPNYSFTTTGNKWNVTIGGYVNYTTTSVPNYGTTSRSFKGLHVTNQSGDCYTFTLVTSYTSQLSETTTFISYVSSTTY
jgi:hypothetical protein